MFLLANKIGAPYGLSDSLIQLLLNILFIYFFSFANSC